METRKLLLVNFLVNEYLNWYNNKYSRGEAVPPTCYLGNTNPLNYSQGYLTGELISKNRK